MWLLVGALTLCALLFALAPLLYNIVGQQLGARIRRRNAQMKDLIVRKVQMERDGKKTRKNSQGVLEDGWEKVEHSRRSSDQEISSEKRNKAEWNGIVGFFHPFCNAGGGGERVLWAAIRAVQTEWPNAICAVYTGDQDVSKDEILKRVEERFNIHLYPPSIVFLQLSTRKWVLGSTWPHFTLLGQSLGSLVLALDGFYNFPVPDIFIDTMGYAFTHALSKFLFPDVPVAAYVHYPTISTDMLGSLNANGNAGQGVNAGLGKGWKGVIKRQYWHVFARLYSWVGASADIVMTNSSWTQEHIRELWGPARQKWKKKYSIEVVFPPTAVEDLERQIEVNAASEREREPKLIYIAQFRPEKNHQLILKAFAKLIQELRYSSAVPPQLVLIGSVRNATDETYIYSLRLLTRELHLTESVTFLLNAPWSSVLSYLQTASIGVNGMWNEHFGIGVVEYQAAGLISVVHYSGGPKLDIVIDEGDGPTGYHASTVDEFASAFATALDLPPEKASALRLRARHSAKRFTEAAFAERWLTQMERLIDLRLTR